MTTNAKCLLVLDDDEAVARTIGFVAERLGFSVACYDAPEPFFEAVRERNPSHVALDLIMPRMDGIEVLRRLALMHCEAELILTSGMGLKVLESAQTTASERGLNISGVLPKPFQPSVLSELLSRPHTSDPVSRAVTHAPGGHTVQVDELVAAVASREIQFRVQPKLDLGTRLVVGAEILACWPHPQQGIIAPDDFIPVAESSAQLMQGLTRLVLEQSLSWFARSPLLAMGSIAVNLSTRSLSDVTLADHIESVCRAHGVPTDKLILEITESSAMDRTADTFDTLTRLCLKGFRLSVDDFGTGYSSLEQLARLPLSELKIDKSFVIKLHTSTDARKIVDATIGLARSMGLICVAEGVENSAALETLTTLGCNLAQGFYISRPLSGMAFDTWLQRVSACPHFATM
ncbi:hypothetical protein B0E46_06600 [Rhodanobacter sp. B04]|uniref:EAL domain-containing response regulator n=1 Tax=Rhodanobacter sp. B04 TaxID=1945860 RepID=UPI000984F43E|nr:EAL domain-containing response regulator [Rhodanobacter sp. B04]OOG65044.1 hypothetical protein B0E46_06600 [Rhodanobacter sp. B04]